MSADRPAPEHEAQGVILSLNAGSSSIKFAIFGHDRTTGAVEERCRGSVEGLNAQPVLKARRASGAQIAARTVDLGGRSFHDAALAEILALLETELTPGIALDAVGHRIVHGGSGYAKPVQVTDAVVDDLARLIPLAPLHQPHNLSGIAAARRVFPTTQQVACFDTAFHRTHDWLNDTYALPRRFYDEGVRRYGFHGLSYAYVAGELARIDPAAARGRTIVAHLGNGASLCAIDGGRAVATTMGFSPLDGLAMGTRSGQLDPSVVFYLARNHAMALDEVENLLYRQSGLLGLSGLTSDMRALEDSGRPAADDAIAYFVHTIRRETGALAAILGGLDTFVFTGGIGENSRRIRAAVGAGLAWLGGGVDLAANTANADVISPTGSRLTVRIVPTNEEAFIAREAAALLQA